MKYIKLFLRIINIVIFVVCITIPILAYILFPMWMVKHGSWWNLLWYLSIFILIEPYLYIVIILGRIYDGTEKFIKNL